MFTLLNQFTLPSPYPSQAQVADVQYVGSGGIAWSDFDQLFQREKEDCVSGETVKILFLLRHGHGEHNPMPKNPMPHWSRFKGLHKPDIVDPALSPIGEEQVSHLALKLQEEINGGMQPPTKVFTSVTKRTCQTATKAWGTVLGPATPILAMQDLRDTLCGRGFSRRGPLSDIKRLFPGIIIQEGTTEEDDLWVQNAGMESPDELGNRVESVFKGIWNISADQERIAIVAHKDVYDVLWTKLLRQEMPEFQPAEMRVVIIKQSDDKKDESSKI